jgi:ketosteroid isomerase-like protein
VRAYPCPVQKTIDCAYISIVEAKKIMKTKVNSISAGFIILWLFGLTLSVNANTHLESVEQDKKTVAELDTRYQQAVKVNDAATMASILADDFELVTGKGKIFTKDDLLKEAREGKTIYERQDEIEQTVRVWGDTAVVTALLWVKGTADGKSFEYKLWFSDTYVRTPKGWRYAFGQSSIPLPKETLSRSWIGCLCFLNGAEFIQGC